MPDDSILIRPARFEDLEFVGSILVESWRHNFTGLVPDDFLFGLTPEGQQRRHERTFAREGVHYRVATDGGRVIGFASAGPSRDPGFCAKDELYAIYLLPDFMGRGIGRRLFESVVSGLAGSGDRGLHLTALAVNPHRGFYSRLGGVEGDGPGIELAGVDHPQVAYFWEHLPVVPPACDGEAS